MVLKVYVINLHRSLDRREQISKQLDNLNIPYEIFPAVDAVAGEHLRFSNYDEKFCLQSWRRPLTAGEVGCFASHYSLWRQCVSNDEPMIVMEDDVIVPERFVAVLRLAEHLRNYEYVRLAATSVVGGVRVVQDDLEGWKLVRYLKGPMGTQCYALFPKAAARFIAHSDTWTLPVDNYMDQFWEHKVPCLGLMPQPIPVSRHIPSTIISDGISPSALMRNRVWRPKRFSARKWGDLRRYLANMQYAIGARGLGE